MINIKNWVSVATVSAIGILFSCENSKGKTSKSRVFEEIVFVDSIYLDLPLYRIQFDLDTGFGYYYPEKMIFKFDKSFRTVDTLGRRGDGPKENLMVRNFQVNKQGNVEIFDSELNRFKVQDFEDSVYFSHNFNINISGGYHFGGNKFVVWYMKDKSKLAFDFLDINTNESIPIESINSQFDIDHSGLIYEGVVNVTGDELFFTSYFASFMFKYNFKTKEFLQTKYIQDFPLPKVLEIGSGVMLDNADELILDSFIFQGKLILISNVGDKNFPSQRFLDVYDAKTLEYEKSYPLPDLNDAVPDEGFAYSKDQIGILYEDLIAIFKP
ncbi:hypothetical protein MM239_12080 [Belliella sp. DSM 111904]|uniref:TolB-like 6-blade propeller-like n=1 Tax=Belliella filtrata TaxID=2923435 RepID=A0ABS9V143_9BACT|nr:hypothetical protein [Belliella filtrata]MCH7410137.1 hypothetical protein [Belliella filtrata]